MNKGLRLVKEKSHLAEWTRQVEEYRNSVLSVRNRSEQKGIAQSTYTYRQNKVWKAINQRRNTQRRNESTLTALLHALRLCLTILMERRKYIAPAGIRI